MSRTAACRERSLFARVAAVWSLATGLLLAAVSPPLQACDGGTAVPNPATYPELVKDCNVLLALRDELVGSGSLNWDTQLAITSWQGVSVLGSPSRGDLTVGPLTVASSSSQLHGTVIYEFLGYLVSVPASELTTEAEIFISKSADENTGLALYNPSATNNITLELVLHTADGNAFYRIYVTLEPGATLSPFRGRGSTV